MDTATTASPFLREPQLLGQTVVLIGGSAGIGLETARLARAEGADVILTGRNLQRSRTLRATSAHGPQRSMRPIQPRWRDSSTPFPVASTMSWSRALAPATLLSSR